MTSRFIKTGSINKTVSDGVCQEHGNCYDSSICIHCEQSLDEVLITTPPPDQPTTIDVPTLYPGDEPGGDGPDTGMGYDFGPGSGTPSSSTSEEEAVKVDVTEAFEENDKINCTYNQLNKTSSIQDILKDFFGDDALFDLTFNVVDNLNCNGNTNATGCTTDLGGNAYRIDIDLGHINDPTTPTIFLAQSLIHEAIHANLFAAVKKDDPTVTSDIKFEELFDKYRENNRWTHEYMALRYVGIMQQALKEVHPLLNDGGFLNGYNDNTLWNWDKFYEYVSYRGLHDTQAGLEYFNREERNVSLYKEDAETFSTKQPNCDE